MASFEGIQAGLKVLADSSRGALQIPVTGQDTPTAVPRNQQKPEDPGANLDVPSIQGGSAANLDMLSMQEGSPGTLGANLMTSPAEDAPRVAGSTPRMYSDLESCPGASKALKALSLRDREEQSLPAPVSDAESQQKPDAAPRPKPNDEGFKILRTASEASYLATAAEMHPLSCRRTSLVTLAIPATQDEVNPLLSLPSSGSPLASPLPSPATQMTSPLPSPTTQMASPLPSPNTQVTSPLAFPGSQSVLGGGVEMVKAGFLVLSESTKDALQGPAVPAVSAVPIIPAVLGITATSPQEESATSLAAAPAEQAVPPVPPVSALSEDPRPKASTEAYLRNFQEASRTLESAKSLPANNKGPMVEMSKDAARSPGDVALSTNGRARGSGGASSPTHGKATGSGGAPSSTNGKAGFMKDLGSRIMTSELNDEDMHKALCVLGTS